ncbi:MAG: winged helix DNA-binding domain-containing protein [Marinicaulis sp.]|nr:winged helix DNA-binding domain-containing protein [Marinicaulis sp.]
MALKISNRDARRLWLNRQGLAETPTGKLDKDGLLQIVKALGFVQMDTIRVVARAHDHIVWSRNQHYREGMLDELVKDRLAFEHFTHDASVLPMETYPYWRRQFDRMRGQLDSGRWPKFMSPKRERDKMLKRIEKEGPLCSNDFEAAPSTSRKEGWARPPHKYALDYLWYIGVLATCHRRNFIKMYATREKVIPENILTKSISNAKQVDWLCENALNRLGFASEGDIMRFWGAADLDEVKAWIKKRRRKLVPVEVVNADKSLKKAWAPADIEERIENLSAPTSRLRILNPFDPAARDRNRLQRLFGFDYRIEIFVPPAKRQYGYYVYPLLEGDRFVGRIEARANRKKKTLTIENFWWERGVKNTPARRKKLDAELERMARFVGVDEIVS